MKSWNNPSVCYDNLHPGHAAFREDSASLAGSWRTLTTAAGEPIPEGITGPDFPDRDWATTELPEAHPLPEYRGTSAGSARHGETVFFRRSFRLDEDWLDRRILLHCGGIGGAMQLWVNGQYAGMSKSGLLPVEFELTPFLTDGSNSLCIVLAPAADTDMLLQPHQWLRRGIFGELFLYSLPRQSIDDLFARSVFAPEGRLEALDVTLYTTHAEGLLLRVAVLDGNQVAFHADRTVSGPETTLRIPCSGARLWSPEDPFLYRIAVILSDGVGIYHTRELRFGFRQLSLSREGLALNGTRRQLCGVNYRRCTDDESVLLRDLQTMQAAHINAVRVACRMPECFYGLCDALGMTVIDSTCVGTPPEEGTGAALQLSRHLLCCRRNHPSVLIWDVPFDRQTLQAWDSTRPFLTDFYTFSEISVHRLQRFLNHEDIDDRPGGLRRLLSHGAVIRRETYRTLPFLVTQFGAVLGNGAVPAGEFTALMRKYPQLCGIFLWNFVDETVDGVWQDGCLTGLVREDGTAHDLLRAVSASFQPLHFLRRNTNLTVQNFDPVRNLRDYRFTCRLLRDGESVEELPLTPEARPGSAATVSVRPKDAMFLCGTYSLEVLATLDGTEQARDCWILQTVPPILDDNPGGSLRDEDGKILLRSEKVTYVISRDTGNLDQILVDGTPLLTAPLAPEFSRPATEFDRSQSNFAEWDRLTLHKKLPRPVVDVDHMTRLVTVTQDVGAGLLRSYRLCSGGALEVELRLRTGQTAPARIGLSCCLSPSFHRFYWTGLGPGDTYADRTEGSGFGAHRICLPKDQDLSPVCSEYGTKQQVHRLALTNEAGFGLQVLSREGICAGVRSWDLQQLSQAPAAASLPASDRTVLNLDAVQNGLSCARILPHTTYSCRFLLDPLR